MKPKPLPRRNLAERADEPKGGVGVGVGSKQALLDEGQGMDLKVEIMERKRDGLKLEYISYRICTQVSSGEGVES